MVMLRLWLNTEGNRATGNALEKALRNCDRVDIVNKCIFNVELVTDEHEQSAAKAALSAEAAAAADASTASATIDESGFDSFKEELGPSRISTLKRDDDHVTSHSSDDVIVTDRE